MRILLTDSGLGGLSVCADILQNVKALNILPFYQLEIKYVNAIPKTHDGYNLMKSRSEQIDTFNRFLINVSNRYNPDAIYIVCNSLSAIYPKTDFSKTTSTPVKGIIHIGLDLLIDSYNKKCDTGIIILAADTTIEENIYANQLIDAGVPRENIVSQACTGLANTISNDSKGNKIYMLIEKYLSLALKKLPNNCKYAIVYLGCTHYGYRQDLFEKFLLSKGVESTIINPNNYFFDRIFKKTVRSNIKYDPIIPTIEFITHYPIPDQEINNISKYLSIVSPETAHALQNYLVVEDLF